MDTLSDLRTYISTFERGRIFFIKELDLGDSPDLVRTSLSILKSEGFIHRLSRGVYYYPSFSSDYINKVVFPSDEYIAYRIAESDNIRIIPSGETCAHILGLTRFALKPLCYISDGAPRTINLYNGHTINFVHSSEVRIFAFNSKTLQALSLAIRYLGKDFSTTVARRRRIKDILDEISEVDYLHDIILMPAWVRSIIEDIRG